jgi:hypothetical protein
MKVNASCPLCRDVVVRIEPEPEPEPQYIQITYGYSKVCLYMIGTCLFLFGGVGLIAYSIVTKNNYILITNSTG